MSKRLRNILKYSIFFAIGVFLVWWQFYKMTPEEWAKFKFALSNANYWLIIPVVVMALASHISRSIRWRILIKPLGYRPSVFNVFGSIMAGYLANSFVLRLGEILKCTLLSRYEKIPLEKLLGTIVFERIFDLLCYIIFIVLTIVIQFPLVGNFVETKFHDFKEQNNTNLLMIKLLLLIVVLIALIFLIRYIYRRNQHRSFAVRFKNFVASLSEGISAVKRMEKRRWFLAHTLFIWSMYLLQIYVGFSAIREVAHLGLGAACSVLTLATIAMIVTPGGIGAFPGAVAGVLIIYSIEQPIGEAFGYLMWGVTTFITIFFGLFFSGLMYYVNKRKQQHANGQSYTGENI